MRWQNLQMKQYFFWIIQSKADCETCMKDLRLLDVCFNEQQRANDSPLLRPPPPMFLTTSPAVYPVWACLAYENLRKRPSKKSLFSAVLMIWTGLGKGLMNTGDRTRKWTVTTWKVGMKERSSWGRNREEWVFFLSVARSYQLGSALHRTAGWMAMW